MKPRTRERYGRARVISPYDALAGLRLPARNRSHGGRPLPPLSARNQVVADWLPAGEVTVGETAEANGLSRAQARVALFTLVSHGLVERLPSGRWRRLSS